MEDEMSFRRITRIYREESSRRSLTPLEPDFFEKLNAYLKDLDASAREQDSKSKSSALLTDECQKATKKRDQVFRLRSRKIANLAASKATGASVDLEPLTGPELAIFENIVAVITDARARIYGAGKAEAVEKPKAVTQPPSKNVVLRILEDIPPFAGAEGNYNLKREDVASLPKKVADILVKKGKAQEIEVQ